MKKGYTRRDFLEQMAGMGTGLFLAGNNLLFYGCEKKRKRGSFESKYKRVILLGMDGLDPGIVSQLMRQGLMPNFSALSSSGSFSPLATSLPPQSPAAWASIATGNNPGHHGMCDFINRRVTDYMPDLAILKRNPENLFGKRESMFLPVIHGKRFWEHTSSEGIPSTVIRWPAAFPPKQGEANVFAGLGVPDINGGLGRYSFYTTGDTSKNEGNNPQVINVRINNGTIRTHIKGPGVRNFFKAEEVVTELDVRILPGGASAEAKIGNRKLKLEKGTWSKWIEVEFDIDITKKISGIVKFYLNRIKPEFELFMTSVELNPKDPAFVISSPDSYVKELSEQLGYFHTLGIPEDTRALSEGRIDEGAFISMCDGIIDEQEKMLHYELNRFREGLLSFVFFTTDRIQHMFWVTRDPEHPLYEGSYAKKYGHVIEDYYRRMDRILGDVLKHVDNKTAILVCSDHGFTSFRRSVHLNSWLVENGFMTLKKNVDKDDPEGGALFEYVDWSKTSAYALGFSSIYLNMRDREGQGIVARGSEADSVLSKIMKGLLKLRDPKSGQDAVKNVYKSRTVYSGALLEESPDLIVGFNEGYRMSWQTAVGGSPPGIFEDNLKKWTGDHIVDPSIVPGILFTNFRLNSNSPGLEDIAPTVVSCFGIPSGKMEGRDLI